ncbi:uncharacterized protein LOC129923603 [Biomphalaria glabrata]|uniref:Uncharacterized protein LOC129923603 n=1 Tax=Biomphalaria glabrata TaxID=6526 RepID=A0A9W2Z896_BIOGL|nr:uncharacterized protein LOC129923603 [Biomphalaria glabrata]
MEALGMPTIRKSLLDPVVTKQSPTTRLLQAARETIASYPAGVTTIYTDGSVRTLEGTVKAGYGAVVRLSGNPESDELSGSCQQKSSLEAELEAMFQALDWVATMVRNGTASAHDIVLFTDSVAALEAIERLDEGARRVWDVLTVGGRLLRFGVNVTLQWVPAHCGVVSHDLADQLAKTAVATALENDEPYSYESVRSLVNQRMLTLWHDSWDSSDKGRELYRAMRRPDRRDACQERKSEARRRSDTVVVLTINYATWPSAGVASMTLRAASGKPKVLGSGGSMVAKLKLKGIDGRAPPGVEPAA